MTTITIQPEMSGSYRAIAGDKESTGRTAGEALDSLATQLTDDEGGTLVIVQTRKADSFFSAAQQERLTQLMKQREAGSFSEAERQELEKLVDAEIDGARRRMQALLDRIKG